MVHDHLVLAERGAFGTSPRLGWIDHEARLRGLEVADPSSDRPAAFGRPKPCRQELRRRKASHFTRDELEDLPIRVVDAENLRRTGEPDRGQVVQQVVHGRRPRSDRATHRVTYADDGRGVASAELFLLWHDGKPFTLRAHGDVKIEH